jgi:hypothetical protein
MTPPNNHTLTVTDRYGSQTRGKIVFTVQQFLDCQDKVIIDISIEQMYYKSVF